MSASQKLWFLFLNIYDQPISLILIRVRNKAFGDRNVEWWAGIGIPSVCMNYKKVVINGRISGQMGTLVQLNFLPPRLLLISVSYISTVWGVYPLYEQFYIRLIPAGCGNQYERAKHLRDVMKIFLLEWPSLNKMLFKCKRSLFVTRSQKCLWIKLSWL